MARTPKRKPSFFKVLLGDFRAKLKIPSASAKSFRDGESYIRRVTLKTHNGSWAVPVNKTGDSLYFHGDGWSEFVNGNRLRRGNFLVFFFRGDSDLDVLAFGRNACLKNPRKKKKPCCENGEIRNPKNRDFEIILDSSNPIELIVPAGFAAATGLTGRKTAAVKDVEGREWAVEVGGESGGGVVLSGGWVDFVKRQGLLTETTCLTQGVEEEDGVLGRVCSIQGVEEEEGVLGRVWVVGNNRKGEVCAGGFLVLLAEIRK